MEIDDIRGERIYFPQNPWALLSQAIGIIVLGIVLLAWPGITIKVVFITFGLFAVGWAIFQLLDAFSSSSEEENRWLKLTLAAVALVAGLLVLIWPDATERIILVILGIWFAATGLLMIAAGLKLPKGFSGKWSMIIFAVIAIGFGIYLLVRPESATPGQVSSVVVMLIGIFAIIEGLVLCVYSMQLRRFYKSLA